MSDGSLAYDAAASTSSTEALQTVYGEHHSAALVCFSARSRVPPAAVTLSRLPRRRAWLRQVHSARALAARPGLAGDGDALWTEEEDLALFVATADCVPILLASSVSVAAVHAGWRGVCTGVVSTTLDRLATSTASLSAWIGPAIGPCCYEVGEDVATRVAAASSADVVVARTGRKPHLDLARAVREQLLRAGLQDVRLLRRCTRCDPALASYRRDGARAGRNYSIIWRRAVGAVDEGIRPNARS